TRNYIVQLDPQRTPRQIHTFLKKAEHLFMANVVTRQWTLARHMPSDFLVQNAKHSWNIAAAKRIISSLDQVTIGMGHDDLLLCRACCRASSARRSGGCLLTIVVENEQTDSRRQVAVLAFVVNFENKFFNRNLPNGCDLLERIPEGVFEAHTSLAAVDLHRSFNNWRFHQHRAPKRHSITSSACSS